MTTIKEVREALEGVIRVADRATVEFEAAHAVLASLDGMVLVPREPTEAMLEAGKDWDGGLTIGLEEARAIYRAMLNAAEAK